MLVPLLRNDTAETFEASNYTVVTPLFAIFFVSMDIVLIVTTLLFVLTIAATVLAKPVNSVLRLLVINQLIACVVFLTSPLQFQSNSLVLSSMSGRARFARMPPLAYCQFVSILLGFGASARSWSVAVFAMFVLVITVRGVKKVTNVQVAVSIVAAWAFSLAICAYGFIPYPQYKVYPVQYYEGVICGPSGDGISRAILLTTSVLWTFLAAILPLVVSITMPIIALCYIRPKVTTGDQYYYNRRIAKLSLFLVSGTVINLVARAIPFIVLGVSNNVATYLVSGLVVSLSPLPTLVIILWFMKSVRKEFFWLVTCRCCCCWYTQRTLTDLKKKISSNTATANIQSSSNLSNC